MEWVDPLGLAVCAARYARYKEYRNKGYTPAQATKFSKWSGLSSEERRALLDQKAEDVAERWVRKFEKDLNDTYEDLDAHFVDKHGPDIPYEPNLKQRAIDGTHPCTGITPRRRNGSVSSQFKSWKDEMHILNEATTREARGLPTYNYEDRFGNPSVIGNSNDGAIGQGFSPNRADSTNPKEIGDMDNWIVRFDDKTGKPFTSYPTK